ncbi:MAG TPA: 30S ribosomal protein S1 [Blastocatellia bacterium]|nr:30S ribosomal protein S1 [Blastocatellia bacterium]HMY70419.1 30S ribosomal protein S1 [Blastocatellia bacterium]HMZ18378.1 30S ribosomal protein S1 [Blastocatellia bacterium]HNG30073.1 30S ribosomal protein S1 [Blastocatellia bacterium]
MSTNNVSQTAVGVSEATEVIQAAADSAQPVSTPTIVETAEAAATATALEPAPAAPEAAEPAESNADVSAEGAESDEMDFGKILAAHEQAHSSEINENEVVKGRVVKITEQVVVIDVGYKSEGIVPINEFKDGDKIAIQPGDEIDVFVKQLENNEGYVELSRADALRLQTWDQIERASKDGTNVIGRVTDRIKGGLRVDIGGIQAFLPGSQVDVRPVRNLDSFRNKEIEVRVIKVNKKRGNIVLSRKVVLEEVVNSKKKETLTNLEEGIVVEGQVKNITEYGAFIDLGGIDGLLHITDMSWGRIQNPNEIFKVSENIQVKILKFDRDKERVSLGYKQLIPDPWATTVERYAIGTRVKGKVASVTDYGAFIELEPGVEGLVHVTEMSWSKRVKHPSKLVGPGQEVEAVVLEVDQHNRRISLGIKQIEPNPWDTIAARYAIGTRVKGRVRNLTDFGAFVEIEDGIDGLVHVSDISWTKRIKHPSEALKKNQEVEAIITAIDIEGRRLSLSIKDLEPNAWDRFFDTHRLGDVVTGKVTRFANFGAFVELEDGIEGLCHVSELSEQHVDKPEDAIKVGQKQQFKILKMDREARKIGLSARAVGKDEPILDVRNYSSGDTGMAGLFEVADYNKG